VQNLAGGVPGTDEEDARAEDDVGNEDDEDKGVETGVEEDDERGFCIASRCDGGMGLLILMSWTTLVVWCPCAVLL